jgi:hypothetical protein
MFIRVNNGHLRVRNGTTAVGCGIRMPRNIHFNVPSGHSINKRLMTAEGLHRLSNDNIDKITKDIVTLAITKDSNKNKPKKYIKF